jgi:hypothetical protein
MLTVDICAFILELGADANSSYIELLLLRLLLALLLTVYRNLFVCFYTRGHSDLVMFTCVSCYTSVHIYLYCTV